MIGLVDRKLLKIFQAVSKAWDETTFREIFGFGMIVIALAAVYKPAGSIALAETYGLNPLLHAIWYAVSGWLLSKYGGRGRWLRWFYTLPMLSYIGLTLVFMADNWERANPVVLIIYLLLYTAMMKLIVDDDG